MGIEDDIRSYLAQGYTPQQIIRQYGFKKSTVYKVCNEQNLVTTITTAPSWSVENISYNRGIEGRYLPGDTVTISYHLMNHSQTDLYVVRTGIQPEWLQMHLGLGQSEWLAQSGTFLLRPGGRKAVKIDIRIPDDLTLGEYDLRFGIEGRYLSPGLPASSLHYNYYDMEWTDPVILRVQYPLTHTIFVSHSTQNMTLVRQLDESMENYGFHCIIAEDIKEPGQYLKEKFFHYIDTCSFFLGLLTHEAVSSQMVIDEINYALEKRKPGIYLIEEGVDIQIPVEWASKFSRYWPIEKLVGTTLEAIDSIQQRGGISYKSDFPSGGVAAALLAFFVGLAAGKSK